MNQFDVSVIDTSSFWCKDSDYNLIDQIKLKKNIVVAGEYRQDKPSIHTKN
jgi:hypothetical protein